MLSTPLYLVPSLITSEALPQPLIYTIMGYTSTTLPSPYMHIIIFYPARCSIEVIHCNISQMSNTF